MNSMEKYSRLTCPANRVLRRLTFLFSVYNRHVRDVDVHEVSLCHLVPKLSQCLNEGHTLYVTDRTTLADGELKAEK
jgi:hypothetical protein